MPIQANLKADLVGLKPAPKTQAAFYQTSAAKAIWEVLEICDEKHLIGAVTSPAGFLKTSTATEYKKRNPATIMVTGNIVIRKPGSILRLLKKSINYTCSYTLNDALLHRTINELKDADRLLVLDESHFFTWSSFELIRSIHDAAGIGVVFLGQERLYDQMRGGNAYLYDQILSRIEIQRHLSTVEKTDVRIIAESICPGLSYACIDFLHTEALGPGKFRIMARLLRWALEIHQEQHIPITLDLLREVKRFLVVKE